MVTYWLIDEEGKLVGMVQTKLWLLGFTRDFVFFGGVDKEGTPFIKALLRRGSEEEDLLYFQGR